MYKRQPLIISGQGDKSTDLYKLADNFARGLKKSVVAELDDKEALDDQVEGDYVVDEKKKTATLTKSGIAKAIQYFNQENLFGDSDGNVTEECLTLQHHINQAIKARGVMTVSYTHLNAAMAGFAPGEAVTIRDLLHGLLLSSGADAAEALAEFVSGSEADFVEQMNSCAKALQLDDTHFTNAWGMDQWGMYSTASDIALLLDAVLKNDLLRGILTTPTYCTESGLELCSTLLACGQDLSLAQGRILGGKTGYTEAAGLCLASFAEIGGREYIVVTMGADGNHTTSPYHIQDTIVLYNAIGRQLAH